MDPSQLSFFMADKTGRVFNPVKLTERRVVIHFSGPLCQNPEELLLSEAFFLVLQQCVTGLQERNSLLLKIFGGRPVSQESLQGLRDTLVWLREHAADEKIPSEMASHPFLEDRVLLRDFVEYFYNYWRDLNRFLILTPPGGETENLSGEAFADRIDFLMHLVRRTYRDITENLTGVFPRVLRQVSAGGQVAAVTSRLNIPFRGEVYSKLNRVPVIRQVLIYPPLVLNPPMNKRKGRFVRTSRNPLELFEISEGEWLCYPAKVGRLTMLIYFHERFFGLGLSLSNLFELATEEDLRRAPDGVYAFGVPGTVLDGLGEFPTVFYEDTRNDLMVGAVPGRDEFGYFGYLKKMTLTLHNILMMRRGKMPFHGALVRVLLRNGKEATLLMIGDTGAGKSETLEAFRELGHDQIRDLIVIADDMGSLEIDRDGNVIGYGTETGAFLRLDDLQPGYAFGQIDRAIIMSPNQVNARILLPVTTYETVIKGHPVDYVLYANNYEEIDGDHPLVEKIGDPEEAIKIFREGTVMSKGTTTSTGLVHSYFANIFGPPQCRELHDHLAQKYFEAFYRKGVFVGQMRTRLGIKGWERKGPEEAARELLAQICR